MEEQEAPREEPFEEEAAVEEEAVEQVEHDLDDLLNERDTYLDLAKRTKADFENYRKRMADELRAAEARGKAALAGQLIGVIDNLERALAAAGVDPEGEGAGPLEQGILLTDRELREALARAGVESYDPAGERFDPEWHEALQTRPADGVEPGTVVEVLQKGFRLDGQVIRAARVVVGE
jgi:molecular chaperone GrpE